MARVGLAGDAVDGYGDAGRWGGCRWRCGCAGAAHCGAVGWRWAADWGDVGCHWIDAAGLLGGDAAVNDQLRAGHVGGFVGR